MERNRQGRTIKGTTAKREITVRRGLFELTRAFIVTTLVGTSLLAVGCTSDVEPEANPDESVAPH